MTIFNPRTAYLRSRKFLHTVHSTLAASGGVADAALTLPTLSGTFEQWDTVGGLLVGSWTGRKQGLVLAAAGTPTIVPAAINGRSVTRWANDVANHYTGVVAPLGVNPASFSWYTLARQPAPPNGWVFTISDATWDNYTGSASKEVSGVPGWHAETWSDNLGGYHYSDDDDPTGHITFGKWVLHECHLTNHATAPVYRVNSAVVAASAAGDILLPFGTFVFDRLTIGAFSFSNGPFSGDIAMVVPQTPVGSVSDRQKVYDWVTAFVGTDPAGADVHGLVAA